MLDSSGTQDVSHESSLDWPSQGAILDVIFEAIASRTWTILPPKSFVRVHVDGRWERGVPVVAMRPDHTGLKAEVCSERGDWIRLNDGCVLVVGS